MAPSSSYQVELSGTGNAVGDGAQVIINQALSQAEELRQLENFEGEKLARAVVRLATDLLAESRLPLSRLGGPYPSLRPFELGDTLRFFGRESQRDEIMACMLGDSSGRLAVLAGEARLGKTSLIRAGLVPKLLEGQHLPLRMTISRLPVLESIQRCLPFDASLPPGLQAAPLRILLRRITDLLPKGKKVCVFLDGFEAFFDQPPEARERFAQELLECLSDEDSSDRWLISLRASRLVDLLRFLPDSIRPLATSFPLARLTRDDARRAIEEPARLWQVTLNEDLVNTLLDDLCADHPGEGVDPARLQLVLYKLIGKFDPAHLPTLSDYERIGRARGVLRTHLNETLQNDLKPEERTTAWRMMSVLAAGGAQPDRLFKTLREYNLGEAAARPVLSVLENNNLIEHSGERLNLSSDELRPYIREWEIEQAVKEKVRQEARRQAERVRRSALRGLFGGALGFSLVFLLTYWRPDSIPALLLYQTLWRSMPGAVAGVLLILFLDFALNSYEGAQSKLTWLVGAAAGGAAFAGALLFHYLFRPNIGLLTFLLVALEGVLWGAVTGLGAVWSMRSPRPWLALGLSSLAGGLALLLGEQFGHALSRPPVFGQAAGDPAPWLMVFLGGMIMPALVILSALLGGSRSQQQDQPQ